MGTNFYVRINVKSRDKEKVYSYFKYLSEHEHWAHKRYDGKYIDIHIGKRSAGWRFLFCANENFLYPLTKEGISEFIQRNGGGHIRDEYGRSFTTDQFWNEEISTTSGWDIESYYRNNPQEKRYHYNSNDFSSWTKEFKPNEYGEFYSDGLRFTVSTYFS